MATVPKMRTESCPCGNRSFNLPSVRCTMSNRNNDTHFTCISDKLRCALSLRSDRHEFHQSTSGGLPAFQFLDIGIPYIFPIMRTTRSILFGNKRPFNVNANNRIRNGRIRGYSPRNHSKILFNPLFAIRNDRWYVPTRTGGCKIRHKCTYLFQGEIFSTVIDTSISIHLHIDKASTQIWQPRINSSSPFFFYTSNLPVYDFYPFNLPCIYVDSFKKHLYTPLICMLSDNLQVNHTSFLPFVNQNLLEKIFST